jgi:hypothetical protein
MRKWCRQGTAALAAGLLAGCASVASPAAAPAARTTTPRPVPYNLYTHCGIDYAQVGSRYYEATPPLSDGSGNPPPGWGNPYQPGTMTVISATQAVFTDKAGHRVVFTLVPSGGPGRTTAPVCS